MPFVEPSCRDPQHAICCVGDICFCEYRHLVEEWNKNPRWTNAHEITKKHFDLSDDQHTAAFLAWMVWFNKKVMPYEDKKEKENGTI